MGNVVDNMMYDLRNQWEWLILQWEGMARSEAAFLLKVQAQRDTLPILRPLKRVLSWHPVYDISVLVWVAFLVSLPWIGYRLCFQFMTVAIITFAVNWVLGVRVPRDLDHRLKQLSYISPYGCPSMEVTMAAVITTCMADEYGEAWTWTAGYGAVAFLCFTRVYGAAHLPHQLVISWAWGAGGIMLVRYLTTLLFKKRVPDHWKIASAFIMFALIMAWVAYRAERNASPFLRIPKSEYTRVLSHIMNQDADTGMEAAEAEAMPDPMQLASDSDADFRGRRRRRNKVDSFVHMLRSMERTARRRPGDEGSLFSAGPAPYEG